MGEPFFPLTLERKQIFDRRFADLDHLSPPRDPLFLSAEMLLQKLAAHQDLARVRAIGGAAQVCITLVEISTHETKAV